MTVKTNIGLAPTWRFKFRLLSVCLILGGLVIFFRNYIRILIPVINDSLGSNTTSLKKQHVVVSPQQRIDVSGNPDILVLCTPWGGLTNVKQRLFDCLKSNSEKYYNQDTRFLIPWLMARPILGPFIPLDLVFDVDHWLNWTQSHGFSSFQRPFLQWNRIIPSTIHPHVTHSLDQYYKNISSWAERSNVTLIREIGGLAPVEPDFGTNAFVLRNDLMPKNVNSGGKDGFIEEETCMVHARIESDWLKYSNNGTNTQIYTPLDKILSSINISQVCTGRRPTMLTADIEAVKSQCSYCIVFNNNTGLDYYIQSAAVDFHRAMKADIFVGNIRSSFSTLVIASRNFKRTFTYSEINGKSCIRPIFQPDHKCSNCSPMDTKFGKMVIQNDCLGSSTRDVDIGKDLMPAKVNPEDFFLKAAKSLTPTTDKVTVHRYEIMYGQFLLPYYTRKPRMKMLEIGLGCGMGYGPGASVALWKKIVPLADLWEAEFDRKCVDKARDEGQLGGLNVLVGDQMDVDTLDQWINTSGGANFDVVIDDGGHTQCQIWTSFQKLWPKLLPGGLYFIEDLHVSHNPRYWNMSSSPICARNTNVPHILKENIEALIHRQQTDIKDVKFIFCQVDACVVGKKG